MGASQKETSNSHFTASYEGTTALRHKEQRASKLSAASLRQKKSQARRDKKDDTVLLMLFVYRKIVNSSMTKATLSRQTNSMQHIRNFFICPSGTTSKQ